MLKNELIKYIQLIKDFLNNDIPVQIFESTYLRLVKEETIIFNDNTAKIIETLFSDLDAFCGDPAIANYATNDAFADIDEDELRKRANNALEQLLSESSSQ